MLPTISQGFIIEKQILAQSVAIDFSAKKEATASFLHYAFVPGSEAMMSQSPSTFQVAIPFGIMQLVPFGIS